MSIAARRALATVAAVLLAMIVQNALLSPFAVRDVVPDLVLLVVVAAGLAYGAEYGLITGFGAGLLLDLAPPSDHYAGRWALALLIVGFLAGRFAQPGSAVRAGITAWLPVAAACAFVGTSVFALTGLLLSDPSVGVGELLTVELVAVCSDVVLALVVIPVTVKLFAMVEPDRVLV